MKIERLMAIMILLLNRKRVQATELAETMEVSLRTIYRDMESLSLAGVPIVSHTGGGGGFEIMDHFRLERQMLSYNELVVLYTALRGLESTQAMSHIPMERLLDKVGAMVAKAESKSLYDSQHIHVDFTPWNRSEQERHKYSILTEAVRDRKRIYFIYTDRYGNDTARNVEPEALVLNGYIWYLRGYCLERNDYRIFKLSRIQQLEQTMDTFSRNHISASESNSNFIVTASTEEDSTISLILLFTDTVKVNVLDHFEEQEIERLDNGKLLVKAKWPDQPWLIPFLLQFGSSVRVLEPASVAKQIRNEALKIVSMYDE